MHGHKLERVIDATEKCWLWERVRGGVCLRMLVAVIGVLLTCGVGCAGARTTETQSTGVPARAWFGRSLPGDRVVNLSVALDASDPTALRSLATAVSTPGSSDFRQFWSVARFARRFGAPPEHVAAVSSALRSRGLRVGSLMANGLSLNVSGTVAEVDRAFSVSLEQVSMRSGAIGFASPSAAVLPAGLRGMVQSIGGLSDLRTGGSLAPGARVSEPPSRAWSTGVDGLARSASTRPHVVTGGPQPCAAATSYAASETVRTTARTAFTADQIAVAYDFFGLYQAGDFGAGQTVALLEQSTFEPADVAAYQACYGTQASVTTVPVGGITPTVGESYEVPLDIDQIIGLAPQARILVYVGPDINATLAQIVSDDKAKIISSSLTTCDQSGAAALDTLLQEAAVQGQSFFKGAGDTGAAECSGDPSLRTPPADPFATSIGGTNLYALNSSGQPVPYVAGEIPVQGVWNRDGSGTGGGISTQWAMPAYQLDAAPDLGVVNADSHAVSCGSASGLCREVPDVSADASPSTGYVIYGSGAWASVGGDSATGPLWAAFAALANASPGCAGHTIGFANPALYQVASTNYAGNFTDVARPDPFSGLANNDTNGAANGLFPVTAGYDMTTGLGSMLATPLAASLCALRPPPAKPPTLSHASLSGLASTKAKLSFTASAGARAPAIASVTIGLPNGLSFATSANSRRRGLTVRNSSNKSMPYHSTLSRGKLTITPTTPVTAVKLTLSGPALHVSHALEGKVKRRKVKTAKVSIRVLDAAHTSTLLTLTLRVAR